MNMAYSNNDSVEKAGGRIDWNADEVNLLCTASQMMQASIKTVMRQDEFDIPARDAAVKNISLLMEAESKLKKRATAMPFQELAALYGAVLLLRDTLKKGTPGGVPSDEEAEVLSVAEQVCGKFKLFLKSSGISEQNILGGPRPRQKKQKPQSR